MALVVAILHFTCRLRKHTALKRTKAALQLKHRGQLRVAVRPVYETAAVLDLYDCDYDNLNLEPPSAHSSSLAIAGTGSESGQAKHARGRPRGLSPQE